MFAPPRREKAARDAESHLPSGDCQYILLHPEVKGLRCACVGFTLNRTVPGSTCSCGHQACYHLPTKEPSSGDKQELDALKDRIKALEEELGRMRQPQSDAVMVDRLSRLEELMDKTKAESEIELKSIYRGISGLWQNVGLLNKHMPYYDDRLEGVVDDMQRVRNRLIEIDDASMRVEDRVEVLENSSPRIVSASSSSRRGGRKASTPPSMLPPDNAPDDSLREDEKPSEHVHLVTADESNQIQAFRERVASVGSGSQAWTVHISLLPTSSQPFPFEKDTAAYKRCLSRGLHRVVIVPDSDSHSFKTAVSDAFSPILRGRPWRPLVAKICDAKNLRGLPMLRQMDTQLLSCEKWDVDFLAKNCAVVDNFGTIMDLYIAMTDDTITWAELRDLKPFTAGLELSWVHDFLLDGPLETGISNAEGRASDTLTTATKSAGDILPTWTPPTGKLKRSASRISRTPSFGSSTDGESSRAKLQRPRPHAGSVEVVERRAEAV